MGAPGFRGKLWDRIGQNEHDGVPAVPYFGLSLAVAATNDIARFLISQLIFVSVAAEFKAWAS